MSVVGVRGARLHFNVIGFEPWEPSMSSENKRECKGESSSQPFVVEVFEPQARPCNQEDQRTGGPVETKLSLLARYMRAWFGVDETATCRQSTQGEFKYVSDSHFQAGYGQSITGNVLDEHMGSQDVPRSAVLGIGPAHGALTLDRDGSFVFVPDEGFSGRDSFWYEVEYRSRDKEQVEVRLFTEPAPPTQETMDLNVCLSLNNPEALTTADDSSL